MIPARTGRDSAESQRSNAPPRAPRRTVLLGAPDVVEARGRDVDERRADAEDAVLRAPPRLPARAERDVDEADLDAVAGEREEDDRLELPGEFDRRFAEAPCRVLLDAMVECGPVRRPAIEALLRRTG